MSQRIALFTFGLFIKPSEHPDNDGFHERNDPILDAVEHAPGFIARAGYEDEPGPPCWGELVYPRFYRERGDGWSPATLSLWQDLESIMAFSYFGLHAEAVANGRQWFQKPQWPPYVLWWVVGDHTPDRVEAVERHEYLHDNGPSDFAFTFKTPFDARAIEYRIDRRRMNDLAARHRRKIPAS
ncbi:MAG: DUF3291 domain-containing protein [Hyphomicrobiales bacterium]|nr:DUF3291 domain-containing protein [Hyphomicrobiales bacterium]